MSEKGNGMQRAVALALLQVYAEELVRHPEGNEIEKPFYLFIDEPEICLHPKGQTKLLSALLELSKNKQIFLTTHSPYFLATPSLKDIGVFVFNKDGQTLMLNPPLQIRISLGVQHGEKSTTKPINSRQSNYTMNYMDIYKNVNKNTPNTNLMLG